MKKSKILIISSFALAMVASLVMAFAMMNVTKAEPASVKAEAGDPITLYFYIDSNAVANKDTVNGYPKINFKKADETWEQPSLTLVEDNLYKCTTIPNNAQLFEICFNSTWYCGQVTSGIADGNVYAVVTTSTNASSGDVYNGNNSTKYIGNYNDTSVTYYFYTTFSAPKAHCYAASYHSGEGTGYYFVHTVWPGYTMTQVSGNLYSISVKSYFDEVIFTDNGLDELPALALNSSTPYYNGNIWTSVFIDPAKYYILDSVNGWDFSASSIVMDDKTAGTDSAMKIFHAVAVDEKEETGVQFRIRKGNGDWLNAQDINFGIGVNVTKTGDNYTAPKSGAYYSITVDDSGKPWIANYLSEGVKSKTSVATDVDNANKYLLMVAGFDLTAYSVADKIGFCVRVDSSTTTYSGVEYYGAVSIPTAEGAVIKEAADFGFAATDKLIVKELECTSGEHTYTVQAQIFKTITYDEKTFDVAIACSDTVSGSITYIPAA